MTDDILCGVRRQTIQSLWHTGCPKKVAFTLLSHCCLLLILPAHDQQICSSETPRWKSKSKFLGNPVLQERTNEYHRKHIALYDITLKTSKNNEFGVFGRSWAHIWARQIWSSGVSLKRSLPDFPIGLRTKNQLCAIWISKKRCFCETPYCTCMFCFSFFFLSVLILTLQNLVLIFWVFSYLWWAHSFFGSIPISIQSSAASGSIYTFSKLCSYSRLVHVPFMFVQWNKSCAESILSISHQLVEY